MAVRIRLRRIGRKNRPFYRIVVTDSHFPRDGRFIETIGYYDPLPKEKKISIKTDRLTYWQQKGATLSEAVSKLLKKVKPVTENMEVNNTEK